MWKKDVGILTWHYYSNVGSNLQAYAIQETLKNLGYTCEFINYRPLQRNEKKIKKRFRSVCSRITDRFPLLLPAIFRFRAYSFQKEYLNQSEVFYDTKKLYDQSLQYTCVICGSDQIWAPNVFSPEYMLSFVPDRIPKIAYAASIGLNKIPKQMVDNYRKYLSRFCAIGVREYMGANMVREILGKTSITVEDVLDPTFLLPASKWEALACSVNVKKKYLFCYFLGDPKVNKWQREVAKEFSKKNNKSVVIYSNFKADKEYADKYIKYLGPKEFLGYIKNADFVFTDSFHGVALSIILKKQVYIFYRFLKSDLLNQNSRIDNIIDKLSLQDRIINKNKSMGNSFIDYTKVDSLLDNEVLRSITFLNNALKGNEKC